MKPIFIQKVETAWADGITPKTTPAFNVQIGDVLVAYSMVETYDTTAGHIPNSPSISDSSGTMTWILQQSIVVQDYAQVLVWTAIVDVSKNISVSFSLVQGAYLADFGGSVLTFRGSNGIGNVTQAISIIDGAPTLNIATTQANSSIVVTNCDWNALDGTTRSWLLSAGTFIEQTYAFVSALYTIYGGYIDDAGSMATKTVGLTAPTGQKYSIIAVEVKGSEGGCNALTSNLIMV
jgi:hypothetical protein